MHAPGRKLDTGCQLHWSTAATLSGRGRCRLCGELDRCVGVETAREFSSAST